MCVCVQVIIRIYMTVVSWTDIDLLLLLLFIQTLWISSEFKIRFCCLHCDIFPLGTFFQNENWKKRDQGTNINTRKKKKSQSQHLGCPWYICLFAKRVHCVCVCELSGWLKNDNDTYRGDDKKRKEKKMFQQQQINFQFTFRNFNLILHSISMDVKVKGRVKKISFAIEINCSNLILNNGHTLRSLFVVSNIIKLYVIVDFLKIEKNFFSPKKDVITIRWKIKKKLDHNHIHKVCMLFVYLFFVSQEKKNITMIIT